MKRLILLVLFLSIAVYAQNAPTPLKPIVFEVKCKELPKKWVKYVHNEHAHSLEAIAREILLPLQDSIKAEVIVTSGHRSHKHNKRVGGAPNSFHIYGRALDFVVKGHTSREVVGLIKTMNVPYTQLIDEGDHIHIVL